MRRDSRINHLARGSLIGIAALLTLFALSRVAATVMFSQQFEEDVPVLRVAGTLLASAILLACSVVGILMTSRAGAPSRSGGIVYLAATVVAVVTLVASFGDGPVLGGPEQVLFGLFSAIGLVVVAVLWPRRDRAVSPAGDPPSAMG